MEKLLTDYERHIRDASATEARSLTNEEKKLRKKLKKRLANAVWRKKNPDYQATWCEDNPDYHAAYREANTDKRAARYAAYYEANKDKIASYNAAYRKAKFPTYDNWFLYQVVCGDACYIGITRKPEYREHQHHTSLRRGSHHNQELLAAFNEHQDFRFELLGLTYPKKREALFVEMRLAQETPNCVNVFDLGWRQFPR